MTVQRDLMAAWFALFLASPAASIMEPGVFGMFRFLFFQKKKSYKKEPFRDKMRLCRKTKLPMEVQMAGKEFVHKHVVYLNETNAMGGVVYFANFIKWQGIVREEFFMRAFPMWEDIMKLVMAGSANMITVEEHSRFLRHVFFGDTVVIKLQTANLKKCSFDLIFKMYRNNEHAPIYEGWQRLTFDDYKGNFIPIPEPFRDTILEYQTPKGEHKRSSMRSERMKSNIPVGES